MTTLADLNRAFTLGEQVRSANDLTARQTIEDVSPYVDFINIEDETYAQIGKDKFQELYEKAPDKILQVLNSSGIATSYTDINTGEVAKGRIVGMRQGPAGITFDIEGKQGIVPKTLGFSNDPKDIVMATDPEGLRGMVNTILQGMSTRMTASNKGYGSRAQAVAMNQGVRLSQGLGQFKDAQGNFLDPQGNIVQDPMSILSQAESAPETFALLEDMTEAGLVSPNNAFELLTNIGTEFNDGLDAYRDKQLEDLKANKKERTRLEKIGEPGRKQVFGTGMSGSMGDGSAGRLGNPAVYEATGRTAAEQKEYKRLQGEREEIAGRLADSNLFFPVGASSEQMMAFIIQNEDLMKEVGTKQETIDKARAAFQKYEVREPVDLARLPDYDSSLDVSKSEIASAIAAAAGGDFSTEYQSAYNLLQFGDTTVGTMDVQTFNRASQKANMELDAVLAKTMSDIQANNIKEFGEKEKDLSTKMFKSLTNIKNIMFTEYGTSESGSPTQQMSTSGMQNKNIYSAVQQDFRDIVNYYHQAKRAGMITPGSEMDNYFRSALDMVIVGLANSQPESWVSKNLGNLWVIGGWFKEDKFVPGAGSPTANMTATYKEDNDGKLVFNNITFTDSTGDIKDASTIDAQLFNDFFNDALTMEYVKAYIKPSVDYSVYE